MLTAIAFWVLVLIGAAFSLAAAIVCALFLVDEYRDWRHKPHQRSFHEGVEWQKNAIRNDSWWFSESPETQELIADLVSGRDVHCVRDKWRRARAAKELTADQPSC